MYIKNFSLKKTPLEQKFFCEDIEPIPFSWTKVDEAMSISVISEDSNFDDLDDDNLEDNDDEDSLSTLVHDSFLI